MAIRVCCRSWKFNCTPIIQKLNLWMKPNLQNRLYNGESQKDAFDVEVMYFLRKTPVHDRHADSFDSKRSMTKRYRTVAVSTSRILAIQISKISSQKRFQSRVSLCTSIVLSKKKRWFGQVPVWSLGISLTRRLSRLHQLQRPIQSGWLSRLAQGVF